MRRPAKRRALSESADQISKTAFKSRRTQAAAPSVRAVKSPSASGLAIFFGSLSIEKSFTVVSYVVAAALIVLCTLDLILGWPWMTASRLFSITYLLCGCGLMALTYDVFSDRVGRAKTRINPIRR